MAIKRPYNPEFYQRIRDRSLFVAERIDRLLNGELDTATELAQALGLQVGNLHQTTFDQSFRNGFLVLKKRPTMKKMVAILRPVEAYLSWLFGILVIVREDEIEKVLEVIKASYTESEFELLNDRFRFDGSGDHDLGSHDVSDIRFDKLAEKYGVTRQALQQRLKRLQERGKLIFGEFIKEVDDDG